MRPTSTVTAQPPVTSPCTVAVTHIRALHAAAAMIPAHTARPPEQTGVTHVAPDVKQKNPSTTPNSATASNTTMATAAITSPAHFAYRLIPPSTAAASPGAAPSADPALIPRPDRDSTDAEAANR